MSGLDKQPSLTGEGVGTLTEEGKQLIEDLGNPDIPTEVFCEKSNKIKETAAGGVALVLDKKKD